MTGGRPVVVACDESGAEGEKLIGGNTVVFAHAGVLLSAEEASACITRLRERIRSPATEYKATHLLRSKNQSSLEWFLGPAGPVYGRAHACLVDKEFFLLGRFAEALVRAVPEAGLPVGCPSAEAMASALYREGPAVSGRERWDVFLRLLNDLMRSPSVRDPRPSPGALLELAGTLGSLAVRGPVRVALGLLRSHLESPGVPFPPDPGRDPAAFPSLDPLGTTIGRAIAHWGGAEADVAVVHDQQTSLTDVRIARIEEVHGCTVRLVSSASDPRVQIADFLAGVARKLASDELTRSANPELTALLRPYIDPRSIWGDDTSWSRLAPTASARPR
ncbi:hypothetical protein [Streptomyces laurentii]|uniref:hypothetical protein n=1 Tax=Streptomyces laurentii TaxID=39478 RepID=UPI0036946789